MVTPPSNEKTGEVNILLNIMCSTIVFNGSFQGYPVFLTMRLFFGLDLNFDQQVCNYGVALGATPSPGLEISMDIHLDSREFFHFGANKLGLCPTWPFPVHLNQKSWFSVFQNDFAYIWLNSCDFVGKSGQVCCLWCVSRVIHDENHSPEPPPEPQASTRITKVNILCQQV